MAYSLDDDEHDAHPVAGHPIIPSGFSFNDDAFSDTEDIDVPEFSPAKLREELAAPLRVLQETAKRIAKVARESKLPIVEDDYVLSFKVELMEAVMLWCRGASFSELLQVGLHSSR